MTDKIDTQYEELLAHVLNYGVNKNDRTGTGTLSSFGHTLRYDLSKYYPLITTKQVHFKSVALELLWFLRGEQNITWLKNQGCRIWNEWAQDDDTIGPMYGFQWRNWGANQERDFEPVHDGIDQIAEVIESIKINPDSRRHLVSAWNAEDIPDMALAPCHYSFQFYVADGRLSILVNQRSADLFLGVPFNIASYALLTHMIADQTGLTPGELIWSGGDCHIYSNHIDQVKTQITRRPFDFPQLEVRSTESIDDFTLDHFVVKNYNHWTKLTGKVAV